MAHTYNVMGAQCQPDTNWINNNEQGQATQLDNPNKMK